MPGAPVCNTWSQICLVVIGSLRKSVAGILHFDTMYPFCDIFHRTHGPMLRASFRQIEGGLMPVKSRIGPVLAGLLTSLAILSQPATAAKSDDSAQGLWSVERQRAANELESAKNAAAVEKKLSDAALPGIETNSAIARGKLEELKIELVSASAGKDMALIRTIQAGMEAARAADEAATVEKMLCLRRVENAGKEQEAWNKRLQSLDLAEKMGLKVMLAGGREIENREKMLDAAAREVDYQLSQIRKYLSRRQNAVVTFEELRTRLDELKSLQKQRAASPSGPANARLDKAIDSNISAVERSIAAQQEWFLMNRTLEARSRRSLSFARFDLKIKRQYAAALRRKESEQLAREAQARAEKAESELDAVRANLDKTWSLVKQAVSESARDIDSAVAALAAASTVEEQAAARASCDAARERYARAQAQNDFMDEYFSLRKAIAGFAREKSDRARSLFENDTVEAISRELRVLGESVKTSAEYVTGMKTLQQKLADQAEAARAELGVSADVLAQWRKSTEEMLRSHLDSSPLDPKAMADQLASMIAGVAAAGPGAADDRRKDGVAGRLVYSVARQAALKERLVIAERWLDNTRASIRSGEKRVADLMWDQRDPRLDWVVFQEFGSLGQAVASDAAFAKDTVALGVSARAGYASRLALVGCAGLTAVLFILCVWIRNRLSDPPGGALRWIVAESAKALPYIAAGSLITMVLLPGNICAVLVGMALIAFAVRYLVYLPLRAGCVDRTFPVADAGIVAALLRALRQVVTAGAVSLVLWAAISHTESRHDMARVVRNLWLFLSALAGIRFLLAPPCLGRLFLNGEARAGLKAAWGTITAACMIAGALALAPTFLSLDNMSGLVMRTVWECLSVVVAACVILWLIGLVLKKIGLKGRLLAVFAFVARAVIVTGLVTSLGLFWWGLANDVVLSPDAPDLVRQGVAAWSRGWVVFLKVWAYDLGSGMTVGQLVWGLACFIASFWVSSVTKKLFYKHVLSHTPMDETTRLTFSTVLGYLIVVTGFLIGLNVAGSSLKNLALLAGAITVGLGFGLQNIINNFVSSLLIHFGRTIRVGDYIEVGGSRGVVAEIGFRNTRITTDDGVTVLVPNGAFVGGNIVNWTNPRRQSRLHVPVSVSRQADYAVVVRRLIDIATAHKKILKDPAPSVEIKSVAADKLGLELLAWTSSPESLSSTVGDLSLEIDKQFREMKLLG